MTYHTQTQPKAQFTALKITSAFALLFVFGSFNSAKAQGVQGIAWIAGEIRGQMAVVEAQAEATLCHCDDYDDVQEELDELCEKMSRFEQLLAEPIRTNQQVRRLRKAAERVEDQADEVNEEIEEALEDLRDDRPRNRHHARHRGFGQIPPTYYQLPPRAVSAREFGYTTPNYGQFVGHRSIPQSSFQSGGVRITFGNSRPRIQFVSTPTVVRAHNVGHPIYRDSYRGAGHLGSFNQGYVNQGYGNGNRGNAATNALCAEADRLHSLTCQLVRMFR